MRSSSKSRSRNKNSNRNRSVGNVVNRVFDSAGPEGKVRGTPQQIIEKYQTLARDAQLSNDRVAAENFLQHSEHYTRMLSEAMREQAERQEQAAEARQREAQAREQSARNGADQQPPAAPQQPPSEQPSVDGSAFVGESHTPAMMPPLNGHDETGPALVETPEGSGDTPPQKKPRTRRSSSRAKKSEEAAPDTTSDTSPAAE